MAGRGVAGIGKNTVSEVRMGAFSILTPLRLDGNLAGGGDNIESRGVATRD